MAVNEVGSSFYHIETDSFLCNEPWTQSSRYNSSLKTVSKPSDTSNLSFPIIFRVDSNQGLQKLDYLSLYKLSMLYLFLSTLPLMV